MQPEDKNAIFQMRFPQKLWYLLNMRTDAILWGGTGRTILLNYRILHSYLQCDHSIFKTTNISSFVRQLNLYGFRKVTSHLQDPLCNSCNPYMHEYVHDYFQYGKPELLNKITRKALAMRKSIKPKCLYGSSDQIFYLTPLQKARRALRDALKKAAQDLFMQNSPKQFCSINFESETEDTATDDLCDNDENIELDWFMPKNFEKPMDELPEAPKTMSNSNAKEIEDEDIATGNIITEDLDANYQSTDNFPGHFLSMPDLDVEPSQDNSGVELLAEFNIECDQSIIRMPENVHNSLNCVLPSIEGDNNDDVSMSEKDTENIETYNGEWDQMFHDMITNKVSNQDCGSDLKDLYSQISRTIDLLND